ncbi:MAG TPA: GTPase HflX [Candidatus Blautia faecipullorum]|nr:GTPase HflX [Candidatus Blautia faecipullorum]
MQLYDFKEIQERVILVGVQTDQGQDVEASLDELEELAQTAGAETAAKVIQNREAVHPGTYIGRGKIQEVKSLLSALDANGVICDDELSPAQMNNLEKELECKVMDRTLLILDIFAGRAVTSEGKIQVELAQLKYRAARLVGLRDSLSRLGGGIGTRGPGEKKLETDRRLIRTRISALKAELKQVEKHRELIRGSRARGRLKTAAIVGYTNAGKSTLLNTLTGAGVQAEDKLFATLDPTTRLLELKEGQQLLLTDTVGFIHKLPHHLVEAFKSTLEEAKYADYIIHVVDASNPQAEMQMHVVYETLRELGASGKKVITLLNKQDIAGGSGLRDLRADYTVKCSARTGQGLDELKEVLAGLLAEEQIYIEELFSYREGGKLQRIREYGQLLSEDYRDDGILVKARVPAEIFVSVMPEVLEK